MIVFQQTEGMIMDVTIDQFSMYVSKALRKASVNKNRKIVVNGSASGIEVILEAQRFHVSNPKALKAEAQARFEELWKCNPSYPDPTYLASVAYEETIRKYPANGSRTTET